MRAEGGPRASLSSLWRHRELIYLFAVRDVSRRYRGSFLGFAWSLITPLILLGIYLIVFGYIFGSHWEGGPRGTQAPLALFCGLVVYNVFAETAVRAPELLVSRAALVKRVPFPLEILPVASVASAIAHGLFSLLVLTSALAVLGQLRWSALLAVVVVVPLAVLCLAASWFLSAAGVFVRDLGHAVGLTVTALLFLSPVLYPLSALPEGLRAWYWLNPLTFIVEDMRAVLLAGRPPAWGRLAAGAAATVVLALLAWLVFARGRRSFADAV